MSAVAANQLRTFQRLWGKIRPHVGTDRNLPARIHEFITKERSFGSRDRRLYRELIYTAVRYASWVEELQTQSSESGARAVAWLAASSAATAPVKSLLTDLPSLPPTIAERAAILGVTRPLLPAWCARECSALTASPNLEVVHERAPLWLRLQTEQPERVWDEFRELGWRWTESDLVPGAVKMADEVDVTKTRAYAEGRIEIQDIGSQWTLGNATIARGARWLDACAGAGGKTLQLARAVGSEGHVVAHDIRADALQELRARATRAGLRQIAITTRIPEELFDGVLVDAPCSGSGTWRRAPHLKWCTSESDLREAAAVQHQLLDRFAARVKPGGCFVYVTCSLAQAENGQVAQRFLEGHSEFRAIAPTLPPSRAGEKPAPGRTLWPAELDSDGFYVAAFQRD